MSNLDAEVVDRMVNFKPKALGKMTLPDVEKAIRYNESRLTERTRYGAEMARLRDLLKANPTAVVEYVAPEYVDTQAGSFRSPPTHTQ